MRILSCIVRVNEVEDVIKAGANEIYFGFSKIPNYSNGGVISSFEEVKTLINIAKKNKVKTYLAANDIDIDGFDLGFDKIIENIKKIIDLNIDGIIVSDIGLLNILKNFNIPLHISSINPVFNSYTLKFFKENFDIKRVILPNQLAAKESKEIINYSIKNNIETEIFYYKFFGCPYINGFCAMHTNAWISRITKYEDGLCRAGIGNRLASVKLIKYNKKNCENVRDIEKKLSFRVSFGGSARILNKASFFDYYLMGVGFLKYGVRTADTKTRIKSIENMKKMINFIDRLLNKYSIEKARNLFLKADI